MLTPRQPERADADAEGNLADRKRGVIASAALADHRAFEDLNSFLVAFLDLDVHTHRISRAE